jgi:hypothetical protein
MIQVGWMKQYQLKNGWYTGTSLHGWQRSDILVRTPQWVDSMEPSARANMIVVYLNPSEEVRTARLHARPTSQELVELRLMRDWLDFKDWTNFDLEITDPTFDPESVLNQVMKRIP